jgi:ABC-type bacteriocin/lantibiotic exporter with double-glycine peptidase domain
MFLLPFGMAAANTLEWTRKGVIPARGGKYFVDRVELAVTHFRQDDQAWKSDRLGDTRATLEKQGCAVTSAAMILNFYGMNTDPRKLNEFLTENGGYTGRGWIRWEKAAEFTPNRLRHAYEDLPSFKLIDTNLQNGNPVIVSFLSSRGIPHFVVIVGKEGLDYLIADPACGFNKKISKLGAVAKEITALRFFQPIDQNSDVVQVKN